MKPTTKQDFDDRQGEVIAAKPFIEQIEFAIEASYTTPIEVQIPTTDRIIIYYLDNLYVENGWKVSTRFNIEDDEVIFTLE